MTTPKRALEHLAAQEWEPALDALLAAWRGHRCAPLAEAIAQLSDWLTPAIPELDTDASDWEQQFGHRAKRGRAVELGRLLPLVCAAPKSQIRRRLVAVLEFPPDPRIAALLVEMIETPPLTASSQFGVWSDLFAALPAHADAGVIPKLEARMAERGGKSQFWTKLDKWITTVIPKLAAPATAPAAWKSDLAQLRRELTRLSKTPTPTLAEPAGGAEPGPVEHDAVDDLRPARTAIEAGQLERGLDLLVGYWAGKRSPTVAALIERLGLLVDEGKPSPTGKTKKARQAAWMDAADQAEPHAIGPLLACYGDGLLADVELRILAMAEWRPDPRVAQALLRMVKDYMIGARDGLWRAVYAGLVHHADPRTAADLHDRHARLEHAHVAHRHISEGRAIRGAYAELSAALAGDHDLTADQDEHAAAIAAKLAALVDNEDDRDAAALERSMVEAIVAAWTDDGPRLVYSDWLQSRQDPRGEFIALDVALAHGKKVKGARDKFFKANRAGILGPLEPLSGYNPSFERGILTNMSVVTSKGGLDLPADRLAALVEDLRWANIRELQISYDDRRMQPVFERAPLLSLRSLARPNLEVLQGFAARADTIPLRELEVSGSPHDDDAEWAKFGELAAVFPELASIEIMIWAREGGRLTPPAACFRGELVRRAKVLRNGGERAGGVARIDEWLECVAETRCPVPRIELRGPEFSADVDQVEPGRFAVLLHFHRLRYADGRETHATLAGLRGLPRERLTSVTTEFGDVADGIRAEIDAALADLI